MNSFRVGFPREGQHCKTHFIPKEVVAPEDEVSVTPEERAAALEYLLESGADLIFGDLVMFLSMCGYRDTGVCIVSEREIIELDSAIVNYGALHPHFQCITNGVSPNYWFDDNIDRNPNAFPNCTNEFEIGISHNSIRWIDTRVVRDQLVQNIKVQRIFYDQEGRCDYKILTSFVINNHKYVLDCVYDENSDDVIAQTLSYFHSFDVLPLDFCDNDDDDEKSETTHYLYLAYLDELKAAIERGDYPTIEAPVSFKSARS